MNANGARIIKKRPRRLLITPSTKRLSSAKHLPASDVDETPPIQGPLLICVNSRSIRVHSRSLLRGLIPASSPIAESFPARAGHRDGILQFNEADVRMF
jgi:hypothetical protein